MSGKHPNKSNDGKRKRSDKNHHNVATVIAMETLLAEDAEHVEEAAEAAAGEETIVSIYRV
jgi:hypothetical protein